MRRRIVHGLHHSWRILTLIRQGLRLVGAAAGRWSIVWIVLLVIQGLLPAGIVYITKWLVDSVAELVQGPGGASWDALGPVLLPAALMGAFLILQQVLGSVQGWVSTNQSERVQDHVKALIHEKAAAVDYEFYESDLYHDQLEQANSQTGGPIALLNNLGAFVRGGITFLSMAVILVGYAWWLPFVLMLSTLPAFYVVIRHNRRLHAWWKQVTPVRRLSKYYDMILTLPRAAAEIRIYNTSGFFKEMYQRLRAQLRTETLRLQLQQGIATLGASFLALLVVVGTMGWIMWRAMRGLATLGDLALFYQVFSQGQSLMKNLFNSIGQVYTNSLFLEHLFAFLAQENKLKDPAHPVPFPPVLQQGVRFEEITFTYPGSRRPALEGFNLFIPAGKVVAVVGENGAGKSTFVKLLCRFYDPDKGTIHVDGTDLRSFRLGELWQKICVMFQFPVKYQLSVKENIRLGELSGLYDQQAIEEAAEAAGAHEMITRLPSGYATQLGRMFEHGAELSGGEWQRIALARAFLRQAHILVLDEPTSFMDSWSELDWMKRFKQLVHGRSRTALLITHRFTTAMQADIIYVMDKGRVIETGTHRELLAIGGKYAESWTMQMKTESQASREDARIDALPSA